MQETFDRVTERHGGKTAPVKHFYRRQYQIAGGEWRTIYYARFKDWKGKRRTFSLGSKLGPAREGLALYEARNVRKEDFDADKVKGMTLTDWLKRYLDLVKATASYKTKRSECLHLKRLLGHLPLTEINRVRIMEYKNSRLTEALIRQGAPVEGTLVQGASVNREVSCLKTALNLAADQGLCDVAPKVKKEREIPRDRILTDAEYISIIDTAPRWLQRVLIAANETAMDRGVLLKLGWDSVQTGLIVVKGGRAKTGARQAVGISPALKVVLDELRAEFRRIPNTDRRVFTKGGKPIHKTTLRHAFDKAVNDAMMQG
ncbi:MAG TPA: hypothetical protein VK603_06035 [Candidatus Saccharimonadales bacterium]|nr:hypothetical protein [Candidatus Saccharimonadales bacterium]